MGNKCCEDLLVKVEYRLVVPWEGFLVSTDLDVKGMHRKISDDLRDQFNLIRRETE